MLTCTFLHSPLLIPTDSRPFGRIRTRARSTAVLIYPSVFNSLGSPLAEEEASPKPVFTAVSPKSQRVNRPAPVSAQLSRTPFSVPMSGCPMIRSEQSLNTAPLHASVPDWIRTIAKQIALGRQPRKSCIDGRPRITARPRGFPTAPARDA